MRLIVKDPVLIIDKPNFVVKLHEDVIEVDLKTSARKDFEGKIESFPLLKTAHRLVSCPVFPSDIELHKIESVEIDDQGQ